jgi:hypothetical protein
VRHALERFPRVGSPARIRRPNQHEDEQTARECAMLYGRAADEIDCSGFAV